jgi:type II secretory pathway pseudopilin PulG
MKQPVPPSGTIPPPLPPDYQQPAPTHRFKFQRKYIAIAVASVIVIVCLIGVLGIVLLRGYSAKAKTEANQFIQNALKKDYKAQYKQINPNSYGTMWLFLVCPTEEGGESHTDLPSTEAFIEKYYASSPGVLSGMFGGESLEPFMQDGKLSSAKVTRIDDQTFYVELNYKGATEPFPLFVKKQNSTYSVDFAATLVFSEPDIANKTKQTVESLIKNPTIGNCDIAQIMLGKAQTLKSELELWLKSGPKSILSDTKTTEINDAIKETEGFEELSAKLETVRETLTTSNGTPQTSTPAATTSATSTPSSKPEAKKKTTPKTGTTATTAPAPTWQTVINVTANTDKRTEPFYLGSGQKKLLYNVTGDSSLVCLIYIVKEGESLDVQGGFPEVTVSSPGPGETVLVNEPGNYYLDVKAANCSWQVTIQELK